MKLHVRNSPSAVARVVALAMIADAACHPRELAALDAIGAWDDLGLSRDRFLSVASETFADLMHDMRVRDRTALLDDAVVDAVLDAVDDPRKRALACRLAVALLPADGRLTDAELALLQRMFDRWQLARETVEEALT